MSSSWVVGWFVVLCAAIALTVLVEFDQLPDETEVVREIQTWVLPGDGLSDAVRAVTATEVVVVAGLLLLALHWLTRDRLAAAVLLVLVVALPLTQAGIKELVDRPRPVEAGIEERASSTSASFPAGHVMSPTVVYGWAIGMLVLWGVPRRSGERKRRETDLERASSRGSLPRQASWGSAGRWGVTGLLVAVLLLSGIGNVQLGVHWPSDVLGGHLWGLVLLLPALGVHERAREGR